jgi:hypothetical protein
MLTHPVIEVSIGGTVVEKRPSEFRLMTQTGFHSALSRLRYPADSGIGITGDDVAVSLVSGGTRDLYFTGTIYSANERGTYRELGLTDSFQKLCETSFTAAYRKEKAASILDDMLGAAGITEKSLTCPDVELARFSTSAVTVRFCLDLLIDALKGHGEEGITYFFDEKDIFHFGKALDTGKNEGGAFSFETGKNILRTGSGWIEVLPRPIRHTQTVMVDGRELQPVRTDLTVSQKRTRLVLTFGEAL